MGTSTRNKGQSGHNPLVPSWLEEEPGTSTQPVVLPIPIEGDPDRFRGPRTSLTHYISSGGTSSGSMHRGVSNYVKKSLGGSANAVKRLGSSRGSTARLGHVLYTLSGGGIHDVERLLSIENLEGLEARSFFIRIAEFVCPDGGPDDQGISRSAYFDTVADNPDIMGKPTENLTIDDIDSILQNYMSKIVMQQIMNGVANNTIRLPDNTDVVTHIEEQIEQFISQSISDACSELRQSHKNMTNTEARKITDSIYLKAFQILERAGD